MSLGVLFSTGSRSDGWIGKDGEVPTTLEVLRYCFVSPDADCWFQCSLRAVGVPSLPHRWIRSVCHRPWSSLGSRGSRGCPLGVDTAEACGLADSTPGGRLVIVGAPRLERGVRTAPGAATCESIRGCEVSVGGELDAECRVCMDKCSNLEGEKNRCRSRPLCLPDATGLSGRMGFPGEAADTGPAWRSAKH